MEETFVSDTKQPMKPYYLTYIAFTYYTQCIVLKHNTVTSIIGVLLNGHSVLTYSGPCDYASVTRQKLKRAVSALNQNLTDGASTGSQFNLKVKMTRFV